MNWNRIEWGKENIWLKYQVKNDMFLVFYLCFESFKYQFVLKVSRNSSSTQQLKSQKSYKRACQLYILALVLYFLCLVSFVFVHLDYR